MTDGISAKYTPLSSPTMRNNWLLFIDFSPLVSPIIEISFPSGPFASSSSLLLRLSSFLFPKNSRSEYSLPRVQARGNCQRTFFEIPCIEAINRDVRAAEKRKQRMIYRQLFLFIRCIVSKRIRNDRVSLRGPWQIGNAIRSCVCRNLYRDTNCRLVLHLGREVRTQRAHAEAEQIRAEIGGSGGAEDRAIPMGWSIWETPYSGLSDGLVHKSLQRRPQLHGSG